MAELFRHVLDNAISAGWLVLIVMLVRLLFRRAPRSLFPVLWGIVGLRLILPFTIPAPFSLVPDLGFDPHNAAQGFMRLAPYIWAAGAAAVLAYGLISYLRLRIKLCTAVRKQRGVYMSEFAPFPFVLGIFRPRIYLPFGLEPEDEANVLLHERAHIKRLDHIAKPAAFALLAVNWFDPLLWVAYISLCRDMELACDEAVSIKLGDIERASYSQTLLSVTLSGRSVSVCPLAFGGGSLKRRVKLITSGRRPALWAKYVSVALVPIFALCFLTDPARETPAPEISSNIEFERFIDASSKKPPVREKSSRASYPSPDTVTVEIPVFDLDGAELPPEDASEFSFMLLVYSPNESGEYVFTPAVTAECAERLGLSEGSSHILNVLTDRSGAGPYGGAEGLVTGCLYLVLPIEEGPTV